VKHLSHILFAWASLCVASLVFADQPASVEATYDIYKDGMKVGQLVETYTRSVDRYSLSSTTTPLGLLAMFKPEKIFISSSGQVDKHGLRPERFSHRRERNENKDSAAEFNWEKQQLTLLHQAQRTLLELPDGTQDRLSAMYQFMFLPLQDATTLDFAMTNGSKLDHYHYAITRGQKLRTPAGEFMAMYLDNQAKPGENRTEIWLAEQHHNLPCKMIVTDADGEQLTQILSTLTIKP
jgi:hypothetical protein